MSDFVLPSADEGRPSTETLPQRIARVTREGGFGRALPKTYASLDPDEEAGDWRSIQSDDPFFRLYLDRAQADRISDGMVKQHSIQIVRFWERMAKLVREGATSRSRIVETFGDLAALESYAARAREDAEALATPKKRTAAADRRFEVIRARILARFEDFILGDGTLSHSESERLLDQAEDEGWTRAKAASFLLVELEQRSFRSASGKSPEETGPPVETLLSSSWSEQAPEPVVATPEGAIGEFIAEAERRGSLTGAQVRSLLETATDAGVEREAAAEFVADRLGVFRDEWCPAPGEVSADSDSLAEALCSVRWLSPARHDEEVQRLRHELENATTQVLLSGTLTSTETERLLVDTPLAREESAGVVLDELDRRDFRPRRGQADGDTAVARLTSVDWVAPRSAPEPTPVRPRTDDDDPVPRWSLVFGIAAVVVLALVAWAFTRGGGEATEETSVLATTESQEIPDDDAPDPSTVPQLRETLPSVETTAVSTAQSVPFLVTVGTEGQVENVECTSSNEASCEAARATARNATFEPGIVGGRAVRSQTTIEVQVEPPPVPDTSPRRISRLPELKSPQGGFEGRARVRLYVEASGRVGRTECLSDLPHDLCARAANAAGGLRFEPATRGGNPTGEWAEVSVRFEAEKPPPCPEAKIERLVTAQMSKAAECVGIEDPAARGRCDRELDAIKAQLKTCN